MTIDPFDSPPVHHAEEASHESHGEEAHEDETHGEEESDLAALELGEAVASARKPPVIAKRRRKPNAQPRRAGMAFLHLEDLPSDRGTGNRPVIAWIILQLLAIAAAAGRFKFWAAAGTGDAPSIELLALHFLLIVQFITSTLIYPILLDSWENLAWSAASAVGFIAIAWVLTSVPPMAVVWAGGLVVMWIAGLAAWRAAVPGAVGTMLIRLALAMVVLGWPIVMYVHDEFATRGGGATWSVGGPAVAVVQQLGRSTVSWPAWASVAGFTTAGIAILLIKRGIAGARRVRSTDRG